MSIEKTKLNYIGKGKIDEEQVMVEALLGAQNVSKVLWVEAVANLDENIIQSAEGSFSGQVAFSVAYLDEDKKINMFETNAPFLSKVQTTALEENAKMFLFALVAETKYVAQSGKLQCLVTINGDYVVQNEAEILCGGDEDICVKTEEIPAHELIKTESLVFVEEVSYPITDKMDNILSVRSTACLKSVIPNENMFTAVGEICTSIKYITTQDDFETVTTVNFTEPFRREIEVMGLTANGVVEAFSKVVQSEFKYELDKETNKILISVPVRLSYRAFEEVTLPYAVDAFGFESTVLATSISLTKSTSFNEDFYENKIEGSIQLDATSPRIDKIIGFSNARHIITSISSEGTKLSVEGLVMVDVAYLNDEEEQVISSMCEVPFKTMLVSENSSLIQSISTSEIVDIDIVARRGRELFVDGKLKLAVCFHQVETAAVISDLIHGEEISTKKQAIEIYFGKKGDDLWDIAKELKVQPELITAQNPDLVLPLEQSENIVVYNTRSR